VTAGTSYPEGKHLMRRYLTVAALCVIAAFTIAAAPVAADTPTIAAECQQAQSYPGRNAADLAWLRNCVHALTPPSPTPTGTPTPTPGPTTPAPTPSVTPTPDPTTPTPTPTATPPSTGWPTPNTTGWKHTGVQLLTVHTETMYVTTPGAVVDSVDAQGGIVVEANNVTIRRSLVEGRGSGEGAGIWIVRGVDGTLVEDVEVTSLPGADPTNVDALVDRAITAEQTTNTTMRRVYAHGTIRGLEPGCSTTIVDSYVDGEVNPGGQHMSAVGSQTCPQTTLLVQHNVIGLSPNPSDSAALLIYPPQVGAYGTQTLNLTWTDNLIRGGTYCLWLSSDPQFTGTATVTGNRFDTTYYPSCGLYGATFTDHYPTEGHVALTWSDNAFVNGQVVAGP
jgi:hypothetical protein